MKHIRAIDISANMLAIARNKAKQQNIGNIDFEQSSLDDLNVSDQSVDMVLAMSILHLIENKELMLERIHQMLKPDGVFVSSTVCIKGSLWSLCWPLLKVGRWFGFMPLVKFFSSKQLDKAIAEAGFDIEYRWQPDKGMAVLFIVAKKQS